MFQLRLTTKREIALWMATMDDQRKRILELESQVEMERKRADAAINLVLAKTTKMILDIPQSLPEQNSWHMNQESLLDLFGEGDEAKLQKEAVERDALERLQK